MQRVMLCAVDKWKDISDNNTIWCYWIVLNIRNITEIQHVSCFVKTAEKYKYFKQENMFKCFDTSFHQEDFEHS